MRKTVIVLGAGASAAAGGPLMADFLDRAEALKRQINEPIKQVLTEFNEVFDAMAELRTIFNKSYLDIDNIEVLFGAIEMGLRVGKFAQKSEQEIQRLRDSLITVIVRTLEESIEFPLRDKQITPPTPYDQLAKALRETFGNQQGNDYSHCSFITFNYDIALEYALRFERMQFDYCLRLSESRDGFPLLKIHGSINWGTCPECQDIVDVPIVRKPWGVGTPPSSTHLWMSQSGMLQFAHHNLEQSSPRFIVPPTWDKTAHGQQRVVAPLAGIAVVACALLSQSVGLADGGVPGQWSGARRRVPPRLPSPGQQLAAHPVKLTDVAPPEAAQEGAQGGWRLARIELESAENVFVIGYSLPETDMFSDICSPLDWIARRVFTKSAYSTQTVIGRSNHVSAR